MINYTPDYEALPQLLCDYLHYIDAVKNRSQKTVFEYSLNLKEFITYIAVDKKITDSKKPDIRFLDAKFFENVTLNDAYKYLSYCKNEKNNSPSTRSRKVVAIRQFFKYMSEKRQVIENNSLKLLDSPKQTNTKNVAPKHLTLEQSINLLQTIDGKNKERDYAIITIFLNCGLRLSELVNLDYTDIKPDNSLRVLGKGNKVRVVYLNSACIKAIERYMAVRPKDGVIDKKALFLSSRLKRISPKTVQHIVYTFLDKAGLRSDGMSVHKLRHTAATLMYKYGEADILILKDILGHENLSTTEIYTHLDDEEIQNAINNNPLAKIDT